MSAEAGELSKKNIDLMSETSGRKIKEDGTVVNEADLMESIRLMEDISGQNALVSIFGDQIMAQRVPSIAAQFFFGVEKRSNTNILTGSANLGIAGASGKENLLTGRTGTTPNSKAVIYTRKRLGYVPGCQFGIWFTTVFLSPPTSLLGYAKAGMFDELDGFWVGYKAHNGVMVSGLCRVKDGVEYFIPRSEFNRDKLDGTGPSKLLLSELVGNIVHIRGGYLGFAPIIFEMVTPTGSIIPFHVIEYPNSSPVTHISNTRLPARMEVYNGDAAQDVVLQIGSLQMYIVDGANADVNTRKFSNGLNGSFTPAGATTRKVWVSYRNKMTYQGYLMPSAKDNNVPTLVTLLNMVLDGQNKSGLIEVLVLEDADLVSGTWSDVNVDDSVAAYSTNAVYNATTLANAKAVFSIGFTNSTFNYNEDVEKYFPELRPGQHRVYTIKSASTIFDYTHSIAWKELF